MARLDLPRPRISDVLAGTSVALVLIPQSLAYAELAHLPAYIGLFASAFPLLAFSAVASSPYLQTGPTAVMSLLTFAALPEAEPAELPKLAALLALMVGGLRFIYGVARVGVAVRLIALPVVTGFTSGAAVLIIASQLPRALGVAAGSDGVIAEAISALGSPERWGPQAIVLSVITVVLFLGGRKLHPLFPGVLVAVIIGVVWSRATNYVGPTVHEVPEGFRAFSLDLPWNELPTLAVGALIISLIGFAEPVSIARTFANEEGQSWNANREFMASGLANTVAAIAGGYPVGGSFSRSSVNKLAGAQTRWAGGVTGLVVLAFLPFASILEPLPSAVLGAIVLGAAWSLVKPVRLIGLWRRDRYQAALAWIVFVATLIAAPRVERAILLGVLLTIGLHFWKGLSVDSHDDGGVGLRLMPHGLFWLGTDKRFDEAVELATAQASVEGRDLTIDYAAQPFLDDPAIQAMRSAGDKLSASGASLDWTNTPDGSERMLAALRAGRGGRADGSAENNPESL